MENCPSVIQYKDYILLCERYRETDFEVDFYIYLLPAVKLNHVYDWNPNVNNLNNVYMETIERDHFYRMHFSREVQTSLSP